ncbi:MAG: hypothetical protein JNK09_01490 [Prolixibacteraceae bacterium]|nr:hypothetical protein [Prolixibacteraceae bacterium]
MDKTIYQTIENRNNSIRKLFAEFLIRLKAPIDIFREYEELLSSSTYILEIDLLKKEYPREYKRFLNPILENYIYLLKLSKTYKSRNDELEDEIFRSLVKLITEITDYLTETLSIENEIQELVTVNSSKAKLSVYDSISRSIKQVSELFQEMHQDRINGVSLHIYPKAKSIDRFKICSEIDQFKIKYPETYEKYLRQLLIEYTTLMFSKDDYISKYLPDYNKEFIDQYGFYNLFSAIDYIVEHLKEIFKIDDVRDILKDGNGVKPAEKEHKIRTPKGKSILTREQNALLFFYLREKRLIAEPTNQNMAIAIKILSGYSESQMQEILKAPETPSHQLGKGNDKVSRNDFKSVITELENLLERIKKDYNAYSYNKELK